MTYSVCLALSGRMMALRSVLVVTLVVVGLAVVADRLSAASHAPSTSEMLPLPSPTPSPGPSPSPSPTATASPSPTPTHTPTPSPSVRAIYAIPSDRVYDARYERAIREAFLGVQKWYGEQLDGITFAIGEPLPQICEMEGTSELFKGAGGWWRVIEGVQHCAPVSHFSEWYTWVIYVDMDVPCGDDGDTEDSFELGRGGDGIAIGHGFDIQGLIKTNPPPCDWVLPTYGGWGGLAHELGHALGLPHPPECTTSPNTCGDQSLMWVGMYEYPETFLRDEDVAYLTELLSGHAR